MKIIDLLNKIAKGEEVPKKIRYIGNTFVWNESLCDYEANGFIKEINSSFLFRGLFVQIDGYINKYILNDEVEIIEEEKEITGIDMKMYHGYKDSSLLPDIVQTINKLKDEINKLKRDKEC